MKPKSAMSERRVIDLKALYGEQAKLGDLSVYLEKAKAAADEGTKLS